MAKAAGEEKAEPMKTMRYRNRALAFTLFEALIVVAALLMLAALLLPTFAKAKTRSSKIGCVNGLKQTGLGFIVWKGDNNDKFPMSVSVANGGTMELVESGTVWQHFQVMSNELNTPKILFCPNDTDASRQQANAFTTSSWLPSKGVIFFNGNHNTSYFIGVDANTNSIMFLAGDRNLRIKKIALKPGLHSLIATDPVGWTKEMHGERGNLLLADGSVQQATSFDLGFALVKTGVTTNRLAIP